MSYLEKQIVKKFNPGDIVFKEDDPGTSMFVIQKGQVALLHRLDNKSDRKCGKRRQNI